MSTSTAKIPIRVHYSCIGRKPSRDNATAVENSIRRLLENSCFETKENPGVPVQAWVVVDGSLPKTKAEIEILRDYTEMACRVASDEPFRSIPFPLIITMNPERWQRSGFRFPDEFLLRMSRTFELNDRLCALHLLHGSQSNHPFCLAAFRDMVVGNFREALGLDHSHHGTTSNLQNAMVDLKQLAQRIEAVSEQETYTLKDKDRQTLLLWGLPSTESTAGRKVTNPLPEIFKKAAGNEAIYRNLFPRRAEELLQSDHQKGMLAIEAIAKEMANGTAIGRNLGESILMELRHLDRSFPRWRGHGLVSLPITRLTGLVVDDQAEELLIRLKQTPIESERTTRKMEELLHFHSVYPSGSGAKRVEDYTFDLKNFLKNGAPNTDVCPRCIDFVLLDLSFTAAQEAAGEKPGQGSWEDPLGWQLLPILRKWLPDIPIIIHSWFGSSTQVRLAYERGAHWFLGKEDDHKLPSHLFHLLEHPHWEREWKAHENKQNFDLPPNSGSEDYHKYLWWRCMKDLPGDDIRIRPMGEGISGAVTVKAWRRINARFDRLPPIIIKIDKPFEMGMEFERYRRFIDPYLSNRAGRIHQAPAHADREHSAIAYTCAGGSQGMASHGRRTEVLSLLKLLEMNLPKDSRGILPADRYEGLFRHLLEDTLPRIHNIDPQHDEDSPNPVFGEFSNPLNGYIARFPATMELQLTSPLESAPDAQGEKLLLTYADPKAGALDALKLPDTPDGLVERWRIRGPLAAHYARHRVLRRNQIVKVKDTDRSVPNGSGAWHVSSQCLEGVAIWLADFSGNGPVKNSDKNFRDKLHNAIAFLKTQEKRFRNLRRGIIHGDLNLGNLMVERELGGAPLPVSNEAWLIDFAWTRRDAIAIDFAQLEMDLLIRLGKRHLFETPDGEPDHRLLMEFRDSYMETRWMPPPSVTSDPRREFLFRMMKQVREAADSAQINATDYEHVRLAALLITAKLRLAKMNKTGAPEDVFATALCLSWTFKQHQLLI